MSYMISYLRWRIITGLVMLLLSGLVLTMTGVGARLRYTQATEHEREQAREARQQYEAELEIRRARQAGGYDPSDPATVRDGYSQYDDSNGSEPYGTNPSE